MMSQIILHSIIFNGFFFLLYPFPLKFCLPLKNPKTQEETPEKKHDQNNSINTMNDKNEKAERGSNIML